MRNYGNRLLAVWFIGVCCGSTYCLAGELPRRFTLGRYIPANSWLYINLARNPERAWLEKEWRRVFRALNESGIERDIVSLLLSFQSETDRPTTQASIERLSRLFRAVRWNDLLHRGELAFAEHILPSKPGYGYIFLSRGRFETAQANMDALVALLSELAAVIGDRPVTQSKVHGVKVWTLNLGEEKHHEPPLSVNLFRRAELIGLVIGAETLKDVVSLVRGRSKVRPMVRSPRFQMALSQVPPPEDKITYFDVKRLLHQLNSLADTVARRGRGEREEKHPMMLAITKAINLCDVVDYRITSVETRGHRTFTHTVTQLQEQKKKCSLACACLYRKPFERFDEYIPASATAFKLSGSVDLAAFYKLVTDFIREDIPGGADAMTHWNQMMASAGFDPHRDLFSWWSGETMSITLPAKAVTLMGATNKVVMIRVKDSELAARKVRSALDYVRSRLRDHGHMLMVTPAPVDSGGFHQVTHPLLAMLMRPVIGVKGDWLVFGRSASAINQCLAVSAGEAPSIMTNNRFREEGLVPKGPVFAASYRDTSRFAQQIGENLRMVGVVGGMAVAMIPDDPNAMPRKRIFQTALSAAMKLGPVLQNIDFYSSESSVSTFDTSSTLRTEKVVTYKMPPDPDKTVNAGPLQ